MSKNGARIRAGISALTSRPYEIVSGTVVAGSVNVADLTISVQLSDDSIPIQGVMLSSISGNDNGMILYPKDGSNVIIGSVDGPGEWAVMKMNEITKATIKIENVIYGIDKDQVNIQNGQVVFTISNSVFKMTNSNESLFQLLKDCFTYLTVLTVPTPAGTSSVPVNAPDFNNLLSRLNNLLSQ